jgi:2-oxoisovalerate dehydrogenase E1 component
VLASFGDASANHSTAQGAFNTAAWAAYQGTPMPLVFLCEDNGIGISTRTPRGWIERLVPRPAGLATCIAAASTWSIPIAARARPPLSPAASASRSSSTWTCVRLYGHAGSDVQATYLTKAQIEADEERDPLLYSAALLIEQELLSTEQILDIYNETEATLARIAEQAITRPKLTTSRAVMASIVPPKRAEARANTTRARDRARHCSRAILA